VPEARWPRPARGYPDTPTKGGAISGLDQKDAKIFHAGTARKGGRIVAEGGRVLGVAALGKTIAQAQRAAYRAVDEIGFPTGFCRRDIGWREIARLKG
jgi:phosphoribosylamine--glycine ligase